MEEDEEEYEEVEEEYEEEGAEELEHDGTVLQYTTVLTPCEDIADVVEGQLYPSSSSSPATEEGVGGGGGDGGDGDGAYFVNAHRYNVEAGRALEADEANAEWSVFSDARRGVDFTSALPEDPMFECSTASPLDVDYSSLPTASPLDGDYSSLAAARYGRGVGSDGGFNTADFHSASRSSTPSHVRHAHLTNSAAVTRPRDTLSLARCAPQNTQPLAPKPDLGLPSCRQLLERRNFIGGQSAADAGTPPTLAARTTEKKKAEKVEVARRRGQYSQSLSYSSSATVAEERVCHSSTSRRVNLTPTARMDVSHPPLVIPANTAPVHVVPLKREPHTRLVRTSIAPIGTVGPAVPLTEPHFIKRKTRDQKAGSVPSATTITAGELSDAALRSLSAISTAPIDRPQSRAGRRRRKQQYQQYQQQQQPHANHHQSATHDDPHEHSSIISEAFKAAGVMEAPPPYPIDHAHDAYFQSSPTLGSACPSPLEEIRHSAPRRLSPPPTMDTTTTTSTGLPPPPHANLSISVSSSQGKPLALTAATLLDIGAVMAAKRDRNQLESVEATGNVTMVTCEPEKDTRVRRVGLLGLSLGLVNTPAS